MTTSSSSPYDLSKILRWAELSAGFRYHRHNPSWILQDINFCVKPGETIAIAGPSGAGKSTLVSLLARLYDAEKGRILVDGYDLRELALSSYRRNLAIVLQDTWLFTGTVQQNIAYAKPRATDEEVRRAAQEANALEFIERLPEGFASQVGERGARLSGGEKQRAALARAILADPRILILDEATSSLDSRNEALIQEALDRLMRGRTTFVIAHRLSTIVNADRILVLQTGRLVEMGTHDVLIARRGFYYRMFMEQYGRVRQLREAIESLAFAPRAQVLGRLAYRIGCRFTKIRLTTTAE